MKTLLIDYENISVTQDDLDHLFRRYRGVIIHVCAGPFCSEKKLENLVSPDGKSLVLHRISTRGDNALDSYIGYLLGKLIALYGRDLTPYVLSKDKGFQVLSENIKGIDGTSIKVLTEVRSCAKYSEEDEYSRLKEMLLDRPIRLRPSKVKSMRNWISSSTRDVFSLNLHGEIFKKLLNDSVFSIDNSSISYPE